MISEKDLSKFVHDLRRPVSNLLMWVTVLRGSKRGRNRLLAGLERLGSLKSKFILALTAVLSFIFLVFIFKVADNIQNQEKLLSSSANVLDVTDTLETKILVTDSDLDPAALYAAKFNGHPWKVVKIPGVEHLKEAKFKEGNFLYYVIHVPHSLLKPLSHLEGQIDLSLGQISSKSSEIFLNGRFFRKSTPVTYDESRQIIPLDKGGDNVILIKSKISSSDRGIDHRNKILLGKAGELYGLHLEGYKSGTVFFLIFILCKGSILFLFTLIYLLLNVGRFFEKSLLFSICTLGKDVLASDFLSGVLDLTEMAYLHNFLNIGASIFLFMFLADVVNLKLKKSVLNLGTGILGLLSVGIISDVLFTNFYFGFGTYLLFWNLISIAVLAYYIPRAFRVDPVLVFTMILAIALTLSTIVSKGNIGLNFEMFGNLLLFFMVGYQSFALFRKEQLELEAKKIQLLEQEKDVAIGKTASLLAHDVRRPLEQMKLILEKVAAGEVTADFISVAKQDVDFSLTSVTNQINDIMNYSKTRQVALSEISFYRVLEGSLKQVMTINKGMNLTLEYDFKAPLKILGDESRLSGALTNLLSNAVEAIRDIGLKQTGLVRFLTKIENEKFVFSMFNDGPEIPESLLSEIFKPLFTHGKDRGTGLGLASVLKTIQDHQGEIEVRNVEGEGVEFILKLSITRTSDEPNLYVFQSQSKAYSYEPKRSANATNRPLRIFLLDDDVQVHQYFQYLTKNLPFDVELTFVTNLESAELEVKGRRFDLYVLDFDLGGSKTGVDFYQEHLSYLRDEIVIHTNRHLGEDYPISCEQVKKPVSFEELESLCEKAYQRRMKILLVDDSRLTLMAWEMFHGRHNIQLADSPEEALRLLSERGEEVDLCVLDYYYDNSGMTGETLANKIELLKLQTKVVLATHSEHIVPGLTTINKNSFDVRCLTI